MFENDHIEIETFDREYGLAELLPLNLAIDLLNDLGERQTGAIVLPGGEVYCGQIGSVHAWLPAARHALGVEKKPVFIDAVLETQIAVFPLCHELEPIGYFVLYEITPGDMPRLVQLGRFSSRAMERLINLNYRNRMTAGLHGQVVEESYAHLKEKAAQLQVSEEKYRALALSLEQEVACKGEEIRETQLAMLQQERLASIGRLAAGMAHEINNPIGFVISNLNTLGGNIADVVPLLSRYGRLVDRLNRQAPESVMAMDLQTQIADITRLGRELDLDFLMQDMQALIDESLEGAERIKSIVQHLKDFAHPSIETVESVDINHCLDTTLAMLEGQIGPRVVVRKNYTDVPAVCCHLRAMNQVFFHLLQNALQAVGDCGEIVLGTRHLEGSRVAVTISDSGPGIAKEHLPHIFDPFFTTREVGAGIGLGLYLAHGIVKKQGGVIVVENAARGGCTFHIRIPVM